jgi:hypothetical protein
MPLSTECPGPESLALFTRNLVGKGIVPNPRKSTAGVFAWLGKGPNSNLLKGFIPPREFAVVNGFAPCHPKR